MGAPRDLRETLGPCRAPAPRRESALPGRFGWSGPCRLAARPRLLAARGSPSSPASPAWEKASAGDSSRTLQRRSFSARRHSPSTSSRLFLPPHVCRVRTPRVTRSASADSQRRCGAPTPWPARRAGQKPGDNRGPRPCPHGKAADRVPCFISTKCTSPKYEEKHVCHR